VQELVQAKALKPSKKFSSGSSRLSLTEKASTTKVGIHGGKTSLPCNDVSGAGKAPKALDVFGSALSTSKDETIVPAPVTRRKRPRKSPPPKTIWKSSDVPPMKGASVWRCSIHLFYVRYIELLFLQLLNFIRWAFMPMLVLRTWGKEMFILLSPPHNETLCLMLRPPLVTKLACWTLR
jgi:hypothetical protein